jgi:hypothetical protein
VHKLTCLLVVSVKCSIYGLLFVKTYLCYLDIQPRLRFLMGTDIQHWHKNVHLRLLACAARGQSIIRDSTLRSYNKGQREVNRKALLSPELHSCCKIQPCLCERARKGNKHGAHRHHLHTKFKHSQKKMFVLADCKRQWSFILPEPTSRQVSMLTYQASHLHPLSLAAYPTGLAMYV